MKIGFNFNYWMVVIPALYILGLGIGYWLVWSGRDKPLRRPFGWRSDLPATAIMLFYSIMSGVVFSVMLFIESQHGIVELLGREDPMAGFVAPIAIAMCGVALAVTLAISMRKMYMVHVSRLRRLMTKRRTMAIIDLAHAEASGDTHGRAGLGVVVKETGNCKVIALDLSGRRNRKNLRSLINGIKRKFAERIQRWRDRRNHMILPERTVERYRRAFDGYRRQG